MNPYKDIMTDNEYKEFVEDLEDGRYDYLKDRTRVIHG